MRKTGLTLALAALGAVAVGCGGDSTGGGGGAGGNAGGAAGGAGGGALGGAGGAATCPSTYGLSDGTFTAAITSVTAVSDGCGFGIADAAGALVPVKYDRATNTLSVGKGVGAEALPSLGSGMPSCPGSWPLTRSNQVTDGATSCYFTDTVTSQFTLAGVDTFTLEVTEGESAFTAGCATTTPCTSTYTLSLARVAAGGAGGGSAGGAGGAKAAGGAGGAK